VPINRIAYEMVNRNNEKLKSRSKEKNPSLPKDYLSEVPSKRI